MLEGRVKTLHPAVHGGLLARRDLAEHMSALTEKGIEPISLLAVNLYPFQSVSARDGVTAEEVIENIDIGGPSMLRSAAKNFAAVTVVVIQRTTRGCRRARRDERSGSARVLAEKSLLTPLRHAAIARWFACERSTFLGRLTLARAPADTSLWRDRAARAFYPERAGKGPRGADTEGEKELIIQSVDLGERCSQRKLRG